MKSLVNNLAFSTLTLLAFSAQAQQSSSAEVTCRAQAKEIATQTYSSCMTEARNGQIDEIRREYQQQLEELKAKYDKELKKVGGKEKEEMSSDERAAAAAAAELTSTLPEKTTPNKSKPVKVTTKGKTKAKGKSVKSAASGLPAKATKGVAKSLPTREERRTPALPARQVRVETPVVVSDVAPGFEEDLPSQNDAQGDLQMELVPATSSTVANPEEFY